MAQTDLRPVGPWVRQNHPARSPAQRFQEAAITITVQLGQMPNMLGDIVEHVLNAYPAARIETRRAKTDNPLCEASRAGAQLLVLREGDPLLQPFERVADLAMLSLDEDGRTGMLTMLHREAVALDCSGLERIAGLFFREREQG